ncbi:FkbM family methyltransferase [Tabrizicola thermarum]|uniref:FkbM family methyltransferase n=1 Tax=Tabrizicola thermarum TaxID=2670345 RepID=UPI00138FD4B9|nr:FkbM family methyltransferase [Tabrizicola thermarum]
MDPTAAMPVFPVVETRFGRMFTLQGDAVISRSLRVYGEFAGDEVDSILSFVRPGDHVLDLGANIGFHTLALARTVGPSGQVTSVEPQRFCFQLLCANVTANQLTTVNCIRAAVGDAPGLCGVPRLDPTGRHNAGATRVSLDPATDPETDTVPLITVDSLAPERCDLIKVDTEGFEDRVVAGARHTLKTLRPVLYIEVHDREKLRRLHVLLKPLGYGLILHHTRFFRPANARGEPANIFAPDAGGSALIALPPGRSLPSSLPGELRPLA